VAYVVAASVKCELPTPLISPSKTGQVFYNLVEFSMEKNYSKFIEILYPYFKQYDNF
jgi:hypothetical protein